MKPKKEQEKPVKESSDVVNVNFSFRKSGISAILYLGIGLFLMYILSSSSEVHIFLLAVLVLGVIAVIGSSLSKDKGNEEKAVEETNTEHKSVEGVVEQTPQPAPSNPESKVKNKPKPMTAPAQEQPTPEPQSETNEQPVTTTEFTTTEEDTLSDVEWKKFFEGL